jgi:inorganic pyrophosphatase
MNSPDPDFWTMLERLVADHSLVIDRPKGTHHPRYQDIIYPLDYGYLEGTTTVDEGGIDVWVGNEDQQKEISALVLTVDLNKNDAEIKIALDCDDEDLQTILSFHKRNKMGAILIRKPPLGNEL